MDTVQFTLTVGTPTATDPTGPDAYGYYAYDNSDTNYDLHPEFATSTSPAAWERTWGWRMPARRINITQVYTSVRPLPFAFTFYGQVYDTITICSNGWCAFGDQGWNNAFRNYPIPAMLAPQAMIAPFWNDLCTADAGIGRACGPMPTTPTTAISSSGKRRR